ncbi:DNA-binding protein [Thermoproteus sp. CP80]|uniref:HEPN domain-containing protein n=1 Tax=Thermoproteus sp. CP80 TaxID=1650659 RepID=UPI0009BF6D6B|nr:HEPN domain-containing protein [Thermoproteus sp. CP80]PLC62643.1 DNA-binding protein [Thermoproteus sp. CP80]
MDCVEFSRWLAMARRTLESAARDVEGGDYNWACFKAHQAAEFAVKGLLYGAGRPARGHSVSKLLEAAKALVEVPGGLVELGKLLDKFYIPTRYVDAWSEGAPYEYFTRGDAESALRAAGEVVSFVEGLWRGCADSGRG